MKLTLFLFILAVFQVSATNIFSQNVKISLDMRNAPVREVIKEIELKGNLNFFYNDNMQELNTKVSVSSKEEPISKVLENALSQAGMTYEVIKENFVVLLPAAKITQIQPLTITGTVTDNFGALLPGVNVMIKGTTIGTSTNMNGQYSLQNVKTDDILIFSFIGMITNEVMVGDRTIIDVSLRPDAIGMDEVVVIGYGTQKKVNLTGSVAVIESNQLENRSLANLDEALQGTAANLNINTGNLGGEPGAAKEINIRGVGTLTGDGGSPYVLVDGMPMDLSSVDPDNIESISVLKDAASAAIYGARAAYGVILITTKSGKGKDVNIQYNSSFSLQHPTIIPDYTSSVKAAHLYNYAASNSGIPGIPQGQMDRIIAFYNGEIDYETIPNPNNPSQWGWGLGQGSHANTNWPRVMWDNWRPRTKHNLSFSGERENVRFYAAANYFDEKGVVRWNPEEHNKYSLIANLSIDVQKWITLNLNTRYARTDLSRKIAPKNESRQHQWGFVMLTPPWNPISAPDGQVIAHFVLEDQQSGREIINPNDFWAKIGAELEPIKGWKTNVNYMWNYYGSRVTTNKKTVYHPVIDGEPYAWRYQNPSFVETYDNSETNIFNLLTSYEKSLGKHNFYAMIGYEEEYNERMGMGIEKMNVISEKVPSLSTAVGEMFLSHNWSHWATQGVFSRFSYNFNEKYLFEFNSRYDGSSRFARSDTQWGFFPSVAVAWNISREPFWESVKDLLSINLLKIRASYGSLGNQNVSQYLYLPIIPISTNLPWIMGNSRPNFSNMPGLVSPDLTWETANTLNVGIDAGFFNNQLNFAFDVFNRKTLDMFGPSEQLPAALGTSSTIRNNAELVTKGFDLEISWKENITSDLSYDIKLNVGDSKSTVTKYYNPTGSLGGMNLNNYANHLMSWYEGKVVGEIWGYETIGYFQDASDVQNHADQSKIYNGRWQEGDIKYKDQNDDGIIDWGNLTLDNPGDLKVIGNDMPRYQFGLTTLVNYKNFDLRMFWQGVAKRNMVFATQFWDSFYGWKGMQNFNTFTEPHMDYWTPEGADHGGGPNAYFPRPYMTTSEDNKNKQYQTKYMQNAAYLRLKDIQLGYTIPQGFTQKIGMDRVWFYVSGSNILTLSPLFEIYDPELLSKGALHGGVATYIHPMHKYYTVGINVTF